MFGAFVPVSHHHSTALAYLHAALRLGFNFILCKKGEQKKKKKRGSKEERPRKIKFNFIENKSLLQGSHLLVILGVKLLPGEAVGGISHYMLQTRLTCFSV